MRKCLGMVLGTLFVSLALCMTPVRTQAQDIVKVAPNNCKVLLDNDQVRVIDFRSKPGDKIPLHSHPAYFTYQISGGGTTTFTSADGKKTVQKNVAGHAVWHPAESHSSVSSAAIHVLIVELKK
ncbi:MAG TPA: hypothetical protein VGS20_02580 [Candidatus Acidoferrales bacterium]|nr:hypothetical protein [Candidatus Acidoferrales bacterium]